MTVPPFYHTPSGAFVIPGTIVSNSVWASGTATQAGAGVTGTSSQDVDASIDTILARLLLSTPAAGSAAGIYSNAVDPASIRLAMLEASSNVLTYTESWGQEEVVWSINDPRRTAATSRVGSDLFARGLVPGRFFGYQIALIMPTTCSVGALGDALKGRAFVTDGTRSTGIFDATKTTLVQEVLVKNSAKILVRVISNKPVPSVDALLAATSCSTANVAACKQLLLDLAAARTQLASTNRSSLAALQSGTDPSWSIKDYVAAPVVLLRD